MHHCRVHDDDDFSPDDQPATVEDTVSALVKRSKRKAAVGIRKVFIQQGRGKATQPGPLAPLVRHGDLLALRAYLFTRLMASGEPWDVTFDSGVWVRVLKLSDREPAAARSLVSKALRRLDDAQLIRRSRAGRKSVVFPLQEDGKGGEYVPPSGERDEPYFQLPLAFWTSGWHHVLELPGLAMLLVALDQPAEFWLPADKVDKWYGFSASTANRGYAELERHQLLASRNVRVKDELAIDGLQTKLMRRLRGDFRKPRSKADLKAFFGVLDGGDLTTFLEGPERKATGVGA
jgi:hypothetical protein